MFKLGRPQFTLTNTALSIGLVITSYVLIMSIINGLKERYQIITGVLLIIIILITMSIKE